MHPIELRSNFILLKNLIWGLRIASNMAATTWTPQKQNFNFEETQDPEEEEEEEEEKDGLVNESIRVNMLQIRNKRG